jgi:hypothetical protein
MFRQGYNTVATTACVCSWGMLQVLLCTCPNWCPLCLQHSGGMGIAWQLCTAACCRSSQFCLRMLLSHASCAMQHTQASQGVLATAVMLCTRCCRCLCMPAHATMHMLFCALRLSCARVVHSTWLEQHCFTLAVFPVCCLCCCSAACCWYALPRLS